MSDRMQSTDWNAINGAVVNPITEPVRSPSIEDRLTTIEQLLASAAEITRQLQEMLRPATATLVANCTHATEWLVPIPTMGARTTSWLCRRCSNVIEQER